MNHHLLCADAAVRHGAFGEVIPECDLLVIDARFRYVEGLRALRAASEALASRGVPALLCTHRPVLPTLLGWLAERACRPDLAAALLDLEWHTLTSEQILAMREKHGVYMAGSGRINVAGLTMNNIDQFIAAVADVSA